MVERIKNLWNHRRWTVIVAGVVLAGGTAFAVVRLASASVSVPTVEVKRGEFVDYLQLRGEVKASKSVTVAAPFEAGDLQIIKIVRSGAQVKKGDLLVQFDVTKLRQDLAQNQSALKAAEAEIEQSRAQARMKEEQDLTDVMKARYDVEAAKLDASKQEILSKIEGEEAKLKLADAEQKLREAEVKLKADRAADAADLEGKKQKSDKALYDVTHTERNIGVLTLRAPIDGLATLLKNWRSGGFFGGDTDFKEGDRAWPGAGIVELPDLSTLQVSARIDESDRGRVKVGDSATARVDAVPDRQFSARVAKISPLATTDFSSGWPFPRNFKMELALEQSDTRLRPGMSATLRVAVDHVQNAILIPAEAAFQKSGKTVAYVLSGSRFQERPIEVGRRGEGQLLVAKGLNAGERVATRDPTEKE